MKFCPECGRPNEGKELCECGYNYKTNTVEKRKEELSVNNFFTVPMNIEDIDKYIKANSVKLKELKKKEYDLGELMSISFNSSGGMMGGFNSDVLDFEKKELTCKTQSWHSGVVVTNVYRVTDEYLDKIKEMIREFNFPAWSEIPINFAIIAYDAPNTSFCLTYDNRSFKIDGNIFMTDEERKVLIDFKTFIYSIISDETLISTKKEGNEYINPSSFMGMPMGSIKENTRFCPECGSMIKEDSSECSCGYKFDNMV